VEAALRCALHGLPLIGGAGQPAQMFILFDGRRYEGQSRCGVSVFDFELPKPGGKATFYGYGPVPSLTKEEIRKPAPIEPKSKP